MSAHPDPRNSVAPPRIWLTKGTTWRKKKQEKKRGQGVVLEGETRMTNDEGGEKMIRLSQGLSECHVDERSSRAAGLSELGEDIVRYGNSSHAMDVSLGSRYVATMADVSGGSQTFSSGGKGQRQHERVPQQHAVALPSPGSLSCNPVITAVSSSSLSFSNPDNNSTIKSSIITAGNDNNRGGNSGTKMTRMVDYNQLGGADDRFVPFGALSNSSFEPFTDTTMSSVGISCFVGGGDIFESKYSSSNVIVPEILATISSETLTRRGGSAGGDGGGGGGGGSFVDNQPGQLGSSQPPAKFAVNTELKHTKKAEKENKPANIPCSDMAGMRKRQQITLTQGNFLEETAKKKKISTNQHYRKHDGKLELVQIKKPGSLNERITYSKGEVWESDDKRYEGCAFTLGYFNVSNNEHEAEIQEMWMKLDHTVIGPKQAASVKENLGCDWVLLENHEKMPMNGQIKVKSLRNKLATDVRRPTIYYTEDGPSSFLYFKKYGNQKTPKQNTDRPIALDIVAGGGGMSVGLKRAGWNVKYKVEMNASACNTLRRNFKGKQVFEEDVAKFLQKLKSGRLNFDTSNIALIHGSPPCQGFSMASKCFRVCVDFLLASAPLRKVTQNHFFTTNCRHKRRKK